MEKSINEVFVNRVNQYKDRLAVEKKLDGAWESATWSQYYERSRAAGLAFRDLGVDKGDRLALLSENRLEWLYTDMGSLGIGACVVPVYATLTAEEVSYVVENSGAKAIVVEDRIQLEKGLYALENCQDLREIVVMNPDGADTNRPDVITFAELLEKGEKIHQSDPGLFQTLSEAVEPEDLATIVYTSGTTGVPKGAMITHKNIMAVLQSLDAIRPRFASDTDHSTPFLPLSHVFERAAGHFYGMYRGITASYCESILTVLDDIQEKKPTIILAVPRVCEKIYQRILGQVEKQPKWRRAIFHWGRKVGARISAMREQKQEAPLIPMLQYYIAHRLIFKKLHQALGGRVRWLTASGAPTSREIILFFNSAGIMVVEGYGMTECFAPAAMSNLSDYRIGTVGRPLPGMEIKLADDGEILIKGDNVFKGYWQMEKETKESFDENGFLMSGDIGEFDNRGFLKITDRKKNLIITSGGKNVAPQKTEHTFMRDPMFNHFLVVGEGKKHLSALVSINLDRAVSSARKRHISFEEPEELLENDAFLSLLDERLARGNQQLASYETIKKIRLIKKEFTQEGGELTPSMKMKRKVIQSRYEDLIDSMYDE